MSSATASSFDHIPFSYSFALKWTVKIKELKDLKNKASVLRSNLYQFKPVDGLRFYLEINKKCDHYFIAIKGFTMWSFKLNYALVLCKGRAYRLLDIRSESDWISFLNYFTTDYVTDGGDVVFHCLVNVCPVHSDTPEKKDDIFLQNEENAINIGGVPTFTIPKEHVNATVIDFIQRGDIPCFTVTKALEVIEASVKLQCEVLKILCMEYLLKKISAINVKEILHVAVSYDLPLLERACSNKILDGRIQITERGVSRIM